MELFKIAISGKLELSRLKSSPIDEFKDLSDSPSQTIQVFDSLLKGARITTAIEPGSPYGLRVRMMTDEEVRLNSTGEVKSCKTINYLNLEPEPGGLFRQQIFGPIKSYHCACGTYSGKPKAGMESEKCHVQIVSSQVRRKWIGHIFGSRAI